MDKLDLFKLSGENNRGVNVNDKTYRLNNIYLLKDGEIIGETDQGWFDQPYGSINRDIKIETGLMVGLAKKIKLDNKHPFIISIHREYKFEMDYLKADLYIPLDNIDHIVEKRATFYNYATERLFRDNWHINFKTPIDFYLCGDRVPINENIEAIEKYNKIFKMFHIKEHINENDIIRHKDFLDNLNINWIYVNNMLSI